MFFSHSSILINLMESDRAEINNNYGHIFRTISWPQKDHSIFYKTFMTTVERNDITHLLSTFRCVLCVTIEIVILVGDRNRDFTPNT